MLELLKILNTLNIKFIFCEQLVQNVIPIFINNSQKFKFAKTPFFQVTLERWQIVFFIAAGLMFFGNLSYIILAQTEELEWNRPPPGIGLSATPTPEPGTAEESSDEEIPELPKADDIAHPAHHAHPHRRHSGARRDSQAFIPAFNQPRAGRRYSTLSMGLSQES